MNQKHSKAKNLLVIISDEHRRDAMGCAGHTIVQTPNLDKLASRGCVFENAYTPSPMCVPTRAALACGDYVHRIRHWDSATPYDGTIRSWMHQLKDQGIKTTSIGKLHFQSSDNDNGFAEEILPMHVVGGIGWAVGLLRDNPPDYDSASELAEQVGSGSSSYTDYDLEITRATETWLFEQAKADTPWATFVSFVSPHYPLTAPEEYYNLYREAEVDMPVGYDKEHRPKHPELENIASFFKYDDYFDEQKIREAKCAYYGLTSFMDDCLGHVISVLEKTGQADDTVIIYTSDHGDMMGDLGFWTKQVMYESSAGVPMIVTGPGFPVGKRIKRGASLLDISATALELFNIEKNEASRQLPGVSLQEIATEQDDTNRTIFSEYHDGGSTTATFMVRWDNWKYIYYVDFPPQLFNLNDDPNEFSNLAQNESDCPHISLALTEGYKRLQEICDPESVNRQCFSDQAKRIEELGGVDACKNAYVFNHTPTPNEQTKLQD